MKKKLIVLVCAILAGSVLIYLALRDRDERQIRRNLNLLARTVTKSGEAVGEIPLMGRTRTIQSLFTENCVVTVGRPVPDITGIKQLTTAYFQAMRMVGDVEVTFHDVSVALDEGGGEASTTMTAKGTCSGFKEGRIEAREIEMRWKKVDGKWRIAEAKAVQVLR